MIDINLTNYLSTLEADKTIAVFKGSIVIPALGNNSVDHVLPVGAGHVFWEGTYTLTGSAQQNDIGGLQYSGLQGAGLEARSFIGGIRIRGINTTPSSVTANYNLSVIASPETGIIPASGTFPAMDNPIAFDSRDDTRKILLTRAFDGALGDTWQLSNPQTKILFRGVSSLLLQSRRIKVYVIGSDNIMYDASTNYGMTETSIAGGEVIVMIRNDLWAAGVLFNTAYIRFYYE